MITGTALGFADRRQHVEATDRGQVHVEDHEIGIVVGQRTQRALAVAGHAHVEAFPLETVSHQRSNDLVVVDDQDQAGHESRFHDFRGLRVRHGPIRLGALAVSARRTGDVNNNSREN